MQNPTKNEMRIYVITIDMTNIHNSDQNDELLQHWDHRLKSYLKQIKSN